jgi:hypothetical protein
MQDVIAKKRSRIKADIIELIDSGEYQEYAAMAHELIDEGQTAERIVAALLKYTFKDELNEQSYREISEGRGTGAGSNVDSKGTARLFVALGREQDYSTAKLAKFLEEEGGIPQSAIKDIKVYDKFSFITVTFVEAEQLLAVFSKNKNGRKPLVTKAKEREGGGGSGGGRSFSRNNEESREGGGERKPSSFDRERKPFNSERKQFSGKSDFVSKPRIETPVNSGAGDTSEVREPRKEFVKKEFVKKEFVKKDFTKKEGDAENKPARKRENKMMDYLEKPASDKPATEKAPKKKNDSSVVDEFMKKFDDDLSW